MTTIRKATGDGESNEFRALPEPSNCYPAVKQSGFHPSNSAAAVRLTSLRRPGIFKLTF
jgi:hypothetical protein